MVSEYRSYRYLSSAKWSRTKRWNNTSEEDEKTEEGRLFQIGIVWQRKEDWWRCEEQSRKCKECPARKADIERVLASGGRASRRAGGPILLTRVHSADRHFEAHLALGWNRALPPHPPPLFFWRNATPLKKSIPARNVWKKFFQNFSVYCDKANGHWPFRLITPLVLFTTEVQPKILCKPAVSKEES